MSALPSIENVDFDTDSISTWQFILSAEAAALQEPRSSAKYNDHFIGVRVLGWFLKDFWDHRLELGLTPFNRLLLKIKTCYSVPLDSLGGAEAQHEKMYSLGLVYRNDLMRLFRSDAEPRPILSRHVSRPSFDDHKQEMLLAISQAPQTNADVKALALYRDGYKCILSGCYDLVSHQKYPEVVANCTGVRYALTECTHLFSENAQDAGKEYPGTALAILELFRMNDAVDKILDGQVNNLYNVLTLDTSLHTLFDTFLFWFEEVSEQPDTYDVIAHDPLIFQLANSPLRRVTFKVDPTVVAECEKNKMPLPDLPDRKLMAIRAACARVAHASGTAEQTEQITEDREMISVLATDGSSADLLSTLLTHNISSVEVNEQS